MSQHEYKQEKKFSQARQQLSIIQRQAQLLAYLQQQQLDGDQLTGLLCDAIHRGHASQIKTIQTAGADINGIYQDKTPLITAITGKREKLPIVQKLLDCGANVNLADVDGKPPLLHACDMAYTHGSVKVVEFLLEHGADVNFCYDDATSPLLYILVKYGEENNNNNNNVVKQKIKTNRGTSHITGASKDTVADTKRSSMLLDITRILVAAGAVVNICLTNGATTPLLRAIFLNKTDLVQYLLKKGADANYFHSYMKPPIMCAFDSPHINAEMIDNLLDANASVHVTDCEGRSPLSRCVDTYDSHQNMELIKRLLSARACLRRTSSAANILLKLILEHDEYFNDLDFIKLALRAGANAFGFHLMLALKTNTKLPYNDYQHAEIIKELIRAGADVNVKLDTIKIRTVEPPLLRALRNSESLSVIQALVDAGACVHVYDRHECTPLMLAEEHVDKVNVVQCLINAGAQVHFSPSYYNKINQHMKDLDNINLPDEEGKTPLMLAAHRADIASVKWALQAGAHVNVTDCSGNTALMYAVMADSRDICALLYDKGASISIEIHIAIICNHVEILEYFIQMGASPSVKHLGKKCPHFYNDLPGIPQIRRRLEKPIAAPNLFLILESVPLSPLFTAVLLENREMIQKITDTMFLTTFDMNPPSGAMLEIRKYLAVKDNEDILQMFYKSPHIIYKILLKTFDITFYSEAMLESRKYLAAKNNEDILQTLEDLYISPWSLTTLCAVKISSYAKSSSSFNGDQILHRDHYSSNPESIVYSAMLIMDTFKAKFLNHSVREFVDSLHTL